MAEVAQACVSVHNFDLFPDDNIAEYWKERKYCGKGRLPVNDQERNMIDLEPVREISHASAAFVGVSYNYYFVATIDQFLGERSQPSECCEH